MEQQNFFEFIKPVLDVWDFNWFPLLCFVPENHAARLFWQQLWMETDPDQHEGWTFTPPTAAGCLQKWLQELAPNGPRGLDVERYIYLTEQRREGTRFHVLVHNFDGSPRACEWLWRQISGGWAITRKLDQRRSLAGLLGHFVMRCGCEMALVNCLAPAGPYTAANFYPWRPK